VVYGNLGVLLAVSWNRAGKKCVDVYPGAEFYSGVLDYLEPRIGRETSRALVDLVLLTAGGGDCRGRVAQLCRRSLVVRVNPPYGVPLGSNGPNTMSSYQVSMISLSFLPPARPIPRFGHVATKRGVGERFFAIYKCVHLLATKLQQDVVPDVGCNLTLLCLGDEEFPVPLPFLFISIPSGGILGMNHVIVGGTHPFRTYPKHARRESCVLQWGCSPRIVICDSPPFGIFTRYAKRMSFPVARRVMPA